MLCCNNIFIYKYFLGLLSRRLVHCYRYICCRGCTHICTASSWLIILIRIDVSNIYLFTNGNKTVSFYLLCLSFDADFEFYFQLFVWFFVSWLRISTRQRRTDALLLPPRHRRGCYAISWKLLPESQTIGLVFAVAERWNFSIDFSLMIGKYTALCVRIISPGQRNENVYVCVQIV